MLAARMKSPDAFRTISEVSEDLDVPQHVLRFWESRFAQIKPVKRAGGRRYYRPEDVDLLRGIRALLYADGYTIRGAQKVLRDKGIRHVAEIGRGEIRADKPPVDAVIEAPVEETDPFDAPLVQLTGEPTHARAAIALLERVHAEPLVEAAAAEPVTKDVSVEDLAAVEEAVVLEEPVAEVATEPSLSGEDRVKLEFVLAELLSLKKKLHTARG